MPNVVTVREMEAEWLDTGGGSERVPWAVRCVWFLSSVQVNWRRFYSPDLRKATARTGTPAHVVEALTMLRGLGRTAEVLLKEKPS
jgi:hypothetical protein